MQMNEIKDIQRRIERAVASRRITEALNLLLTMASMTSAPWSVTDEIGRLRDAYTYMSSYALDGREDPGREGLYAALVRDIRALSDRMARVAQARDTSSLYFDTLRYASLHPEEGIRPVIERLQEVTSRLSLQSFGGKTSREDVAERERLETRLFRAVWIAFPLSRADYDLLRAYLEADTTPRHVRQLLVSALLLGQLQYPDERRVELLADLYMAHADKAISETAMRALVALVISLWAWRDVHFSSPLAAKLAAMAEMPRWDADARMVSLLLLRTRDTEKITRTLNEEVIPSMLKIRPDIYKKLNHDGSLPDDALTDANPEWEELMKRTGLDEKLRKLSELQEQGADVMMATFSHLKSFPFFSEIANWFMPFHDEHSAVLAATEAGGGDMADMVAASEFVSSSDRFSMLFAVNSIPEAQRRAMMRQMSEQNIDIAKMRQAELAPDEGRRELLANNYVRDLYRFFKLFRRKGEFTDIFAGSFNPLDVPLLRDALSSPAMLEVVAEFFFSRGYWDDAIRAYMMLVPVSDHPATLYQKMGYARQKLGDIPAAITLYEKAEMLDPHNRWTWRRLAACYRLAGNPRKALEYYERLAKAKPDDLGLTLQRAGALAEDGRYADALKLYFKVEFLDPDSHRALRPIAWTAFLSGDYDTSRRYFDRVMADSPTPADIINLGHLEMATGHYHEAIDIYRRAVEAPGGGKAFFAKTLQEDLRHLRAAGVNDLLTGIVLDRILSE